MLIVSRGVVKLMGGVKLGGMLMLIKAYCHDLSPTASSSVKLRVECAGVPLPSHLLLWEVLTLVEAFC